MSSCKVLNKFSQLPLVCRKTAYTRHFSLISGISGLALLLCLTEAHALDVVIEGPLITVTEDENSQWNIVGDHLIVGDSGTGELIIENGGEVSSRAGIIGNQSGSNGSVTVTGTGSQWKILASNTTIGDYGAGELTITDGGTVISNSTVFMGHYAGSTGNAIVTGTGSRWNVSGDLNVGISGAAELSIVSGGAVSSTDGYIGRFDGGRGTATVAGPGSQWNMGSDLYVGIEGTGGLTISNGCVVSNTDGYIGFYASSNGSGRGDGNGSVTVTGQGSEWNNSGILYLGIAGTGELTVSNGGVASNATGHIGYNPGSNGNVTVTGTGSQWSNSGLLSVGGKGTGELVISAGGVVASASGIIGNQSDSSGIVTMTGTGSKWALSSSLSVGHGGTGKLIIENGGIVSNTVGTIGASSGSNGSVTVTGAGSQWNTGNRLYVGRGGGTGELIIADGGVVVSVREGVIGSQPDSRGSVTVTGAGSQLNITDVLYVGASNTVGERATGELIIADGGVVSSRSGSISSASGSISRVIVTGIGSQWNSTDGSVAVGAQGNGELIISNGGAVSSIAGSIGSAADSSGRAIVTGAGSRWNISGVLQIGAWNDGQLTIADGGAVSNTIGMIGRYPGSDSRLEVTGAGSQWSNSGILYVGPSGTGELIIGNGGLALAKDVMLAVNAVGVGNSVLGIGTLSIGASEGQAPQAPGVLDTHSITFGPGTAKLVFNHTSTNYVFDATINNGADNAAGSGTGLIGNGLIDAVAGRTILNAYHGDFTGTLQASTGILQVNHDMSHVTTLLLPGGTLEGHGVVSNLVNEGIVAPGGSIGTLTIAGNYTGSGGVLHIETVLGDDSSPTDKLVITGDVSGSTPVFVTNLGGSGAESADGIRIIEIGGVSPGNAFTLKGDYVTPDGQQAVIGGAYAYTLRHNSEADPNDGHWYLTSRVPFINPDTGEVEEGPRYQPGVPLYEQYPQVLASLNTVPTLQQRVGNTYWSQNGAAATVAGNTPGTYGAWGRIEGTRTASDPARSTSYAHRDTDLWKLQTGFDFGLHQSADGSQLIGGVNVSYGKALADIASPYGRGKIDATGTGIAATLTWYSSGGFYVDGQAQVTWFDSDITSTTEGRKDVRGNNGHGYVLSAETGNRYQLGNGFFLTPQVQLVYSRVDFDSFTDPFGARVSLNDGDSLRGRFGVSLDHEAGWVASDGTKSRSHLYAIANLYNEFLDGSKVYVDDVRFATRDERLWAGIGIGGTYEWANGAYAFYGNANIAGSVEHMSDSYAFGGTLGFRARW